jgi:hypothetical protein
MGKFLVKNGLKKLGEFSVKDDFGPDPFPEDEEKFLRNFLSV